MLFICLFSHGAFLVTFGVLGVRSLALLNVGSVLIYLVSILLLRRGAVQAAYALGVTEVATHSVAATLVLGWDSGFHYYIPVLAVLMFVHPRGRLQSLQLAAIALGLGYAGLAFATGSFSPSVALPADVLRIANAANGGFLILVLSLLSFVTTSAALQAEDGLRDAVVRLDEVARTDELTGLMNRRSMEDELRRESARCDRTGRAFAIALADLDGFKGINDAYGHQAGDRVLAAAAACMLSTVRLNDQVARWGGEEFLILLPETEDREAVEVASRLCRAVRGMRLEHEGHPIGVTVTLGVAVRRDGDWSVTLREADRALYRAKTSGRDRVLSAAARSEAPIPTVAAARR